MSIFKKGFSFSSSPVEDETNGQPSSSIELSSKDVSPIVAERKDSVVLASGQEITESQANRRLSLFKKTNRFDPNMEKDDLERIDELMDEHNTVGEVQAIEDYLGNSPYPEVCEDNMICN